MSVPVNMASSPDDHGSQRTAVDSYHSLPQDRTVTCRVCRTNREIALVAVPFVFRYLAAELMAMNIRLRLDVG